jgi:hypothetical protein
LLLFQLKIHIERFARGRKGNDRVIYAAPKSSLMFRFLSVSESNSEDKRCDEQLIAFYFSYKQCENR